MIRHTLSRALLLGVALASVTLYQVGAAEDSPISSDAISTDNSEAAISAARAHGAASASKDIEAGTLRILYYGKPWSVGKPLVDGATGYRVQVLSGCVITRPFAAEVESYNSAMRGHAKDFSSTRR